MKQYIDRNMLKRLIKWVPSFRYERCDYLEVGSVINVINTIPHEDVQPVIHANWIPGEWSDKCSNCGYNTGKYESPSKYCPDCGAKMDEEVSE